MNSQVVSGANAFQISQWLDEVLDDEEPPSESTEFEEGTGLKEAFNDKFEDSDVETAENTDHDSTSEQSADDEDVLPLAAPEYIGRDNRTVWKIHAPPRNRRRRARNIVLHAPGVKGEAKEANNIIDCWKLFFPDTLIEKIVEFTNTKISHIRENYSRPRDVLDTDVNEIKALLGLLYLAGFMKSSHQRVEDLWATDGTAPEHFRLVMRYNRFYLLLRALRLDDIRTRAERKSVDKLAAVRDIFEEFVLACKSHYSLSEYVTIDEMLESFRGRCSFRQYMPKKPSKYGIKIFAMVDSRMFYTSNMEIYSGKQPDGPYFVNNDPKSVVKRLVEPIENSGRNVTMDNWFTSVSLVNELVHEKNLTVVGTIRKNKREIPSVMVNTKPRPVNSSLFAFGEDSVMVSYVPKRYRNVLLISSMHDGDEIDYDTGDKMKPEIVSFYNLTKGGVDVVDELKSRYTSARISFRWPLRIFFTILDIASINSQIIFKSNTGNNMPRRHYLKSLALELTKPQTVARATASGIHKDLRLRLKRNADTQSPVAEIVDEPETARGRVKCGFCPRKKNRKTTVKCAECKKPICGEHTITVCVRCHGDIEHSPSGSD